MALVLNDPPPFSFRAIFLNLINPPFCFHALLHGGILAYTNRVLCCNAIAFFKENEHV